MGGPPQLRTARFRRIEPEGPPGLPAADTGRRAARAEFFLCLARAFSPPVEEAAYEGLTRYLADDLAVLAARIGYALDDEIAAYRKAIAAVPDRLTLLQDYARLFLTPPVPVAINTGIYLDGSVLGPSELEMERWYARHGLERASGFRDLNDHAVIQIEFVAHLFGQAAERQNASAMSEAVMFDNEAARFLAVFPCRWLPAFRAELERAVTNGLGDVPYLALARLLERVVAASANALSGIGVRSGKHGFSTDRFAGREGWTGESLMPNRRASSGAVRKLDAAN